VHVAGSRLQARWYEGRDLFDVIHQQHGSFARYLRIHNNSRSQTEAGVKSPGHPGRNPTLFPSRLPWSKPPGKSWHRRGLPVHIRMEAFKWMHTLWALLNFLDAGSPSSTLAIEDSVGRAFSGEWTAQHEGYARTMYAKVLRYCAHPRGTMDRGPAKLI